MIPRIRTCIKTLPRRGYQLLVEAIFPEEEITETPDRFRLDRKLGEGGMGEVYLAHDSELGRRLALKFLRPGEEDDEIRRRRLRREARAAALLDHPFICKIYDTGKLDGRDFIAMEYIEGEKLSQRLRKGPLPVGEALRIALEMIEALEVAHRHGIVHRDIKPSNVILTDQEHVKITDFGIAKKIQVEESGEEEWTQTATVSETTGTPAYMSPEQIRLEPVDHRTDLFLFGIVFYEMLAGVHPFKKGTQAETTSAILQEDPTPVSEYLEDGKLQLLNETVSKLLAKKPEERYQLAHHVRAKLQGIIDQSVAGQQRVEAKDIREEICPYPGLASFTRDAGLSGEAQWKADSARLEDE
jgi:serine/threonine-protein kinase